MAPALLRTSLLPLLAVLLFNLQACSAQSGDGGGVPSAAAQPTTAAQSNAEGASGGGGGTIDLSTGSTVAIAVVVGVVLCIGIGSTILWYIAKKRQWKVRETIRRSARRVGSVLSPMSPKFPFSPRTPQTPRFRKTAGTGDDFEDVPINEKPKTRVEVLKADNDLEKGLRSKKPRPELSIKTAGKSSDPGPLSARISKWTNVFGRG